MPRKVARGLGLPALAVVLLGGCSVERLARGGLADAMSASREVFASDDDPDLVRDAMPFTLKTLETLLARAPRDPGLLLDACSGFTQYAYAFLDVEADRIEQRDYAEASELRDRARRMYERARDYCVRHLALDEPRIGEALRADPQGAVQRLGARQVPAMYWSGASWGSAIALGSDEPELAADLPAVRALLLRALALDEDWADGAIHEALIGLEGAPPLMGGSPRRAREHFRRAVELSRGRAAGPYVSLARAVAVPAQDRAEFERLLAQALAVDPDAAPARRVENLIAQRRARALLASADELFYTPAVAGEPDEEEDR